MLMMAALCCTLITAAQEDLIDKVYGTHPARPAGYRFTHVVHYDLVQRVEAAEGQPAPKRWRDAWTCSTRRETAPMPDSSSTTAWN